jgi:hypothetical protein
VIFVFVIINLILKRYSPLWHTVVFLLLHSTRLHRESTQSCPQVISYFYNTPIDISNQFAHVSPHTYWYQQLIFRCKPPTRRWFLLIMGQMRMRKISWRMTSCYYASWKHSKRALAHYMLFEMLDVFSLCVVAQLSVAPANGSPLLPLMFETCPHCARHAQPTEEIISFSFRW